MNHLILSNNGNWDSDSIGLIGQIESKELDIAVLNKFIQQDLGQGCPVKDFTQFIQWNTADDQPLDEALDEHELNMYCEGHVVCFAVFSLKACGDRYFYAIVKV